MKEPILTDSERNFLLSSIQHCQRLDCRNLDETRPFNIEFRSHPGCVSVTLGQTHVIAQASCRIIKPKEARASEGVIRLHLDMSKIPLLQLENWKHQEFAHELNAILEQNIIHSNCVDLESLCIVAGELVWSIKIDLIAFNNGGNILDCANIATLCSLFHYRLPDISVHGSNIRVFSSAEREARPVRILHFPINVLFAFFVDGRCTLIDPSLDEERLMSGFLSISMNQHKEICGIHFGGKIDLKKDQLDNCKRIAFRKVIELTDRIRQAVADYYRKSETVKHSEPSIVRTDSEEEVVMTREDPLPPQSDITPSPDDANVSLLLIPEINRLTLNEDEPTLLTSESKQMISDQENEE